MGRDGDDVADALHCPLIGADVCVEPVQRVALALKLPETGIRHGRLRDLLKRSAGVGHQLQQHVVLALRRFRRDLCRGVLYLPSIRELHRKPQLRMKELVAADDAVARTVAEDDAVDAALIDRLAGAASAGADAYGIRLDERRDLLNAICGSGMGRQPVRDPLARSRCRIEALERVQHAGDAMGIPAALGRVSRAQAIGLQLVVTSVLQEQDA